MKKWIIWRQPKDGLKNGWEFFDGKTYNRYEDAERQASDLGRINTRDENYVREMP